MAAVYSLSSNFRTVGLSKILAIGFVLLSIGPEIGDTLRCYSCSSLNNAACADPPNVTQMEVTECGPLIKNAVCSKRTTKTPQLTFTGRRCLPEDICDYALNLDQLSEQCDTCTTDLCNSSPHLTSITSVIFLGSIFSLLKVLLHK
ncbi:uncharacterized protein LOC129806221 isoform X2 [Phlebotomus papatasi]|uniref:uncharacterized protein LOC129806221 isoform X2 n=1 Tax=Phlebotomus papatasi TaxID=29031 RepID=UPI0024843AE1|nr:uncharacterized protein LOC129806221 isoform X2 [Phlebotomus papatasi]